MPLNKIADEIQIQESEALRIAVYGGLRRGRGGCYDDGQFFRIYIKYLHQRLYGFAPVGPPVDETPTKRKPTARARRS